MKYPLIKPIENRKDFVGRSREVQRLESFLFNSKGGTILVSGDRGNGKTSLVDVALEEYKKRIQKKPLNRMFKLTREPLVRVDLPFIPKHLINESSGDGKLKAEMSSLVIKAIVQALVNENKSRRWNLLAIRKSCFRPLGYLGDLRKLDRLTRYVSLNKTVSHNLGFSTKGVNFGQANATNGELDLSDTVIEVRLRKLLSSYSNRLSFVFVFDELDKINQPFEAITFVHYLKNLFTQCNAHFMFITTEEVFSEIDNAIKPGDYPLEHTLFSERILLNNIEPAAYNLWVRTLFVANDSSSFELDNMLLALAWETKYHPYDTLSILKRSQIIEGEQSFIDEDELLQQLKDHFDYYTTIQFFVDFVFSRYRENSDGYYNKYLYKTLRKVSINLLGNTPIKAKRGNLLTLLYIESEFPSDGVSEADFKEALLSELDEQVVAVGINDWRPKLFGLGSVSVLKVEKAILEMVWLLDREGSLNVSPPAPKDMVTIFLNRSSFRLTSMVDKGNGSLLDLNDYYRPTLQESRTLKTAVKIDSKFRRVMGQSIWQRYSPGLIDDNSTSPGRLIDYKKVEVSGNLRQRFNFNINAFEESPKRAIVAMRDKLIEELGETLTKQGLRIKIDKVDDEKGTYSCINEATKKNCAIVFNVLEDERDVFIKEGLSESYINLVEDVKGSRSDTTNDRWVQYYLGKGWEHYRQTVGNVAKRLAKVTV